MNSSYYFSPRKLIGQAPLMHQIGVFVDWIFKNPILIQLNGSDLKSISILLDKSGLDFFKLALKWF